MLPIQLFLNHIFCIYNTFTSTFLKVIILYFFKKLYYCKVSEIFKKIMNIQAK